MCLFLGFFPDFSMLWGQLNPNFDWLTSGYNRFFHFGHNYIDSSVALDLIRYQITENYWGDFESIVEDYTGYQATYFPDNIATIWIPILLLATKKFNSQSDMSLHIKDYNTVFMFKQFKQYRQFRADIFFKLDNLTKLQLLRDPQPIDSRVFHLEKIFNLYFSYNSSQFLANQPSWSVTLTNPLDFYSTLVYDYNEDLKIEERERNLMFSLSKYNYDYTSNTSIFFKKQNFNDFIYNLPWLINEKIFDDSGYVSTTINRIDEYNGFKNFTWLSNLSLLHCEYIPMSHYNWKITILDSTPFEWSFALPIYYQFDLRKFINAIYEGFSITFLQVK